MTDNKKNTGHPDDYLISFKEKYEVDYALKQLEKKFPDEPKKSIKDALFDAARKNNPSEGRKKIMDEASKKLKSKKLISIYYRGATGMILSFELLSLRSRLHKSAKLR